MNTLANHLNELEQAQIALDNWKSNAVGPAGLLTKTANDWRNWVMTNQQDPRLARVASASQAVAEEAAKAFKGSGTSTQQELAGWEKAAFNPALARDAHHAANKQIVKLAMGQLDSVADQWDRAFGATRPHISFLSPKAQESYSAFLNDKPDVAPASAALPTGVPPGSISGMKGGVAVWRTPDGQYIPKAQ
jgi:hypothetical protein